jgi:hypothetical protein
VTNIEITLSAAVFITLIHQLGFQPRATTKLVNELVKDLREHVKECEQKVSELSAMLINGNQVPAE